MRTGRLSSTTITHTHIYTHISAIKLRSDGGSIKRRHTVRREVKMLPQIAVCFKACVNRNSHITRHAVTCLSNTDLFSEISRFNSHAKLRQYFHFFHSLAEPHYFFRIYKPGNTNTADCSSEREFVLNVLIRIEISRDIFLQQVTSPSDFRVSLRKST